ncbi:MAG TPA: RNA polymerase sigma factor [Verrucomicrobiota bacterium]|nr:RNA polymerase sigma factor [Verrucomicrobiota bacterium]HNT14115.1 RNA polymerase sigma factor [Verrucomicrobiota bacterium]
MGSEAQLLTRCRQGEAAAWDELFDLHYAATGRFVFQLASDFTREDVEEVCQDTFLSVIRNLDSFREQSQFRTWLFHIAANKARDFREKRLAAKRGGGQVPLSLQAETEPAGLVLDPSDSAPAPDLRLLQREQAGQVREAVALLDAPCREIIELRYFGDLSYEELSRLLQLNPKTVSSRLSKCLDKLELIVQRCLAGENLPDPV